MLGGLLKIVPVIICVVSSRFVIKALNSACLGWVNDRILACQGCKTLVKITSLT